MSGMFVADWGHSATNIATDVFVGAGLDCLLPAEITGRIILGLAAALPVLGAALLSRLLHGRWSYWQMMFGVLAWPLVLLTGFMSLQLAFGAALIAAWLDRWFKAQPAVARPPVPNCRLPCHHPRPSVRRAPLCGPRHRTGHRHKPPRLSRRRHPHGLGVAADRPGARPYRPVHAAGSRRQR